MAKKPTSAAATPRRRANFEHHGSTEQDRRESDSVFDSRQRHSHQSQHSAESHHHRKRDRQNPNRRSAELRAPQTDRNHRQHVIESRDRVTKAGEESNGFTFLRMGKGRSERTGIQTQPAPLLGPEDCCRVVFIARLRRATPRAAPSRTRRASRRCSREAPAPIAASGLRVCGRNAPAPGSAR